MTNAATAAGMITRSTTRNRVQVLLPAPEEASAVPYNGDNVPLDDHVCAALDRALVEMRALAQDVAHAADERARTAQGERDEVRRAAEITIAELVRTGDRRIAALTHDIETIRAATARLLGAIGLLDEARSLREVLNTLEDRDPIHFATGAFCQR